MTKKKTPPALSPNPEEHSMEQRPDRAPLNPPAPGTREQRLQELIDKGNPLAMMLEDAGSWRHVNHSNIDGTWQVREFLWPTTDAAQAAIKALKLEE